MFGIFNDDLHHHLQTTAPAAGVQVKHLKPTAMVYANALHVHMNLPHGQQPHLQALINAVVVCATLHMGDHCGNNQSGGSVHTSA
jgi:hypothetical protein